MRSIDAATVQRFAWRVMALLFAGSVVNYIDRAALGVVMPQIRRDLSLSNAAYGFAVNAFLITYMVFYILGGHMADRLGCRRMFSLSVVFWSAAKMAHFFARGLGSLCFFRALLGVGEGCFYPTAIRGITEWFAPDNRAKGIGVLLCGLSVGALLTPPGIAWIAVNSGWRVAFLVTGATGLLLIPPWLVLHRRVRQVWGTADPAPAAESRDRLLADTGSEPLLGQVLRSRKYLCLLAARSLTDAAWYFYLFWMPGYFQEARGLSIGSVGRLLWIPYLAADAGALGGAWVSSAFIKRGWPVDRARKTVLLGGALLAAGGAAACKARAPWLALAIISVALLGHQAWSSNMHTAITEVSPGRLVALLYGITGAAGTFAGAISQPVIGRLVDFYGYVPPFLSAGAAYMAAAAIVLLAGRIERIAPPAGAAAAGTGGL